jgi:parallel beta-helix repeat protein
MRFGRFSVGLSVLVSVVPALGLCNGYYSGDISGTWRRADSPHIIIGDVRVPPGQSLMIEPGCEVLFRGYYRFIVDSAAVLHAVGTENDSIVFDEETPGTYWHGIRFLKSSNASIISYARLQHGRATGTTIADASGGAVYCHYSSPTLSHNTFAANSAPLCEGGAVYCDTASAAVITSNLFLADSAAWYGGAIVCALANPLISGNTFTLNNAGAIHIYQASPTISHNLFSNNTGGGGAIDFEGGWTLYCYPVVTGNTFIANRGVMGGAIYWGGSSRSTGIISQNVFMGNESGHGGAIGCGDCTAPLITNCVFVSNYAPGSCGQGGALYIYGAAPTIEECTFAFNRADLYGGAICALSGSQFAVRNTIFWGDSAPTSPEVFVSAGSEVRMRYSDVQGGWPGEGNIDMDPFFVAPPDSVQLQWGSPCIDAGDPASPLDPDCTRADMGAYYHDQGTGPRRRSTPIQLRGSQKRVGPLPER